MKEDPLKGSGAEPRSFAGGFAVVAMVTGGGGGAGGFGAGGFFDEEAEGCGGADEEAEGCGGADLGGGLDEDGMGLVDASGGWVLEGAAWTEVCGSSLGRVWTRCSGVRAARVRVTDLVVVSKSAVTLWSSLEEVSGKITGLWL